MSQELERYKTLCVAQEAEIARLKQGFDELKAWIDGNEMLWSDEIIDEINRITGE